MIKNLRAAIVGCGTVSGVHAQAIEKLEGVTLCACADPIQERAEAMANTYHCKAYSTLDELLSNETIDVLHICTPHYLHAQMINEASKRGIAVFSEKPPVINRSEWETLKKNTGTIGVCFQNRYNPPVAEFRKRLASGAIGPILGARAFVTWKRETPYYRDSGWRGFWETEGGGALINQSIHTLDLLVSLIGKPLNVKTYMTNAHLEQVIEVEDTVLANISFANAGALFYATTSYCMDSPVFIEFVCENAIVRIEEMNLSIKHSDGTRESIDYAHVQGAGKEYWGSSHPACIADFYRALSANEKAPIALNDIDDTVLLMLKMYEQGKHHLA